MYANDNINKYRISHGMRPLTEDEKKQIFNQTMKEIDDLNHKLKVDHTDRFGNYHIYD